MEPNYDRTHPYPIVLLRRAGDAPRLEAIVALLRRCGELEPPVVFTRHRGPDMTWAIEELTVEWLRRSYDLIEEPAERAVAMLAVMTEHDEPVKLMYQRQLRFLPHRYEVVTIDVPWAPRKADRPVLQTRAQLLSLLREAAVAFDADIAALYPRSLHALVRLASGIGVRDRDGVDGGNGSSRGVGPIPPFISDLPAGLFERFAALLPARRFDAATIPEAVWWVNVWGPRVVEAVGRERIEAQPWARIEPAGDGGLFLQTTRERPGPGKPEALARIADITEGLELPALQAGTRT